MKTAKKFVILLSKLMNFLVDWNAICSMWMLPHLSKPFMSKKRYLGPVEPKIE